MDRVYFHECDHWLDFSPSHTPFEGDTLYCIRCQQYRTARRIDEYVVKCTECKYAHRYGKAELTAKTKATVHALKRMHIVEVTLGEELVERISPKVTQEILPDGTKGPTDPPF